MSGEVISVNISQSMGVRKTPVAQGELLADWGLRDDAHAGPGKRQISLLAWESFAKPRAAGLELNPGDFAENITTQGMELFTLPLGAKFRLGTAEVEVSQIGKQCHNACEIKKLTGDCVMPREGIFVKVLKPGLVKKGDLITLLPA